MIGIRMQRGLCTQDDADDIVQEIWNPADFPAWMAFITDEGTVQRRSRPVATTSARRSPRAAHEHGPRGDQEHDGEPCEDEPVGAGGLRARVAVRREQRRPESRAAVRRGSAAPRGRDRWPRRPSARGSPR